jgi:hypothetical protein
MKMATCVDTFAVYHHLHCLPVTEHQLQISNNQLLIFFYHIDADDFTPHERPKADDKVAIKQETRPLPPYNGYGTYQDSAANCRKIIPVRPPTDFNKFLSKDR